MTSPCFETTFFVMEQGNDEFDTQKIINQYGKSGWEPFQIIKRNDTLTVLWFKRPTGSLYVGLGAPKRVQAAS